MTLGGSGSTPSEAPVWDAKGRSLYLRAADGVNLDLYRLDVKSKKLEALTDLDGNLVSMSMAGGAVAWIETKLDEPGTLYAGKPGGKMRALASVNDAVADFRPETREVPAAAGPRGRHRGGLPVPAAGARGKRTNCRPSSRCTAAPTRATATHGPAAIRGRCWRRTVSRC